MSNNKHRAQKMDKEQNVQANQGFPIDADFVVKQYEAEVMRLTKENMMLKAYIAQGNAQKGTK